MIFLRYWLFPALISFSWFNWRFQIYKNEFEIIDNELKACVEWGKSQGIFLPEKPKYWIFFLVERPWNLVLINIIILPIFILNIGLIFLFLSPWQKKVHRYKKAMNNLKIKWEREFFKGSKNSFKQK